MSEPVPPVDGLLRAQLEQRVLRLSIGITALVAVLGIVFGLLTGSYAIVFDGMYSLMDGIATVVALMVARLIASSTVGGRQSRRLVEHFTMGFWHLEPIVLGAASLLLCGATIYALINAVGSLLTGGRALAFGQAIVYALATTLLSAGMALFGHRANRIVRSDLVSLDVKGWIMSAAISAALFVAFVIGYAMQGTAQAWMVPYVDPLVLTLVCLVILPMPFGTIRRALADILLVTPPALKRHVDEVAQQVVERHGFLSYRAYVARVGRGRQIELNFVAPGGWPARTLEEWDALRDEISDAIGDDTPNRWLTIAFTSDAEWAE